MQIDQSFLILMEVYCQGKHKPGFKISKSPRNYKIALGPPNLYQYEALYEVSAFLKEHIYYPKLISNKTREAGQTQ